MSHGWHVGIVVPRAAIPDGLWPEAGDFPHAEYLEVGWGDWDYYQSRDPGLGTTLKAGLWPTRSVLHVVGFRGPVADYFPHSEVIELPVTHAGVERLVRLVDETYDRKASHTARSLGPGLYGDSRYYPARGTFHVFNNCNVWSARALRAAGYGVDDAFTAGGLLSQARRLGTVVRKPAR